jgi:hypothetical protein
VLFLSFSLQNVSSLLLSWLLSFTESEEVSTLLSYTPPPHLRFFYRHLKGTKNRDDGTWNMLMNQAQNGQNSVTWPNLPAINAGKCDQGRCPLRQSNRF